ncbi:hypothetical protein F4703DRAFT_1842158 [Phycomyces blakesleeanus]
MSRLYIILVLLAFVAAVCGQGMLTIQQPLTNEQWTSNSRQRIEYTIVGNQTLTTPLTLQYPSSFDIVFQWTARSDATKTYQLDALSGLSAVPYPGGTQNKVYSATWKLPGCRFFSRYTTQDYTFNIVFVPKYPSTTKATVQKQSAVTVALDIQVNNATFPRC